MKEDDFESFNDAPPPTLAYRSHTVGRTGRWGLGLPVESALRPNGQQQSRTKCQFCVGNKQGDKIASNRCKMRPKSLKHEVSQRGGSERTPLPTQAQLIEFTLQRSPKPHLIPLSPLISLSTRAIFHQGEHPMHSCQILDSGHLPPYYRKGASAPLLPIP